MRSFDESGATTPSRDTENTRDLKSNENVRKQKVKKRDESRREGLRFFRYGKGQKVKHDACILYKQGVKFMKKGRKIRHLLKPLKTQIYNSIITM